MIDDNDAFAQVLHDVIVEFGKVLQIDAELSGQCLAGLDAAPQTEHSIASRTAGQVVSGIVETALADKDGGSSPTARVVAAIAANPAGSPPSLLPMEKTRKSRAKRTPRFSRKRFRSLSPKLQWSRWPRYGKSRGLFGKFLCRARKLPSAS